MVIGHDAFLTLSDGSVLLTLFINKVSRTPRNLGKGLGFESHPEQDLRQQFSIGNKEDYV